MTTPIDTINAFGSWLAGYVESEKVGLRTELAEALAWNAALEEGASAFQQRIDALTTDAATLQARISELLSETEVDGRTIDTQRARILELLARIAELEAPPAPAFPTKIAGGLASSSLTTLANVRKNGPGLVFNKVPWSSVERSRGVYDWAGVHATLDALQQGERIFLRVQGGNSTPQYLKDLTGSVKCVNSARGLEAICAHWWEDVYLDAWAALMASAGAEFDGDERVVLVSADAVMTIFSESFLTVGGSAATSQELFRLGLTREKQIAAIKRSVDDTIAAFPRTLVELAVSSAFQYPLPSGVGRSWEDGREIILDLHAKYGKRVAFTDYGLGVEDTLAAHAPGPDETIHNTDDVYTMLYLLAKDGFPIGFQLTPNGKVTPEDYRKMAQNAVDLLAWWCETSGWGMLSAAILSALDAALRANQYRLAA